MIHSESRNSIISVDTLTKHAAIRSLFVLWVRRRGRKESRTKHAFKLLVEAFSRNSYAVRNIRQVL